MGNKDKSRSVARFIKSRLDQRKSDDQIIAELDDSFKTGALEASKSAKYIFRWYLNYFKKKDLEAANKIAQEAGKIIGDSPSF